MIERRKYPRVGSNSNFDSTQRASTGTETKKDATAIDLLGFHTKPIGWKDPFDTPNRRKPRAYSSLDVMKSNEVVVPLDFCMWLQIPEVFDFLVRSLVNARQCEFPAPTPSEEVAHSLAFAYAAYHVVN